MRSFAIAKTYIQYQKKNCTTCHKDIGRVRMSEQYIRHYTVSFFAFGHNLLVKSTMFDSVKLHRMFSAPALLPLHQCPSGTSPTIFLGALVIVAIHRVYTHLSNGKLHVVFTILGLI